MKEAGDKERTPQAQAGEALNASNANANVDASASANNGYTHATGTNDSSATTRDVASTRSTQAALSAAPAAACSCSAAEARAPARATAFPGSNARRITFSAREGRCWYFVAVGSCTIAVRGASVWGRKGGDGTRAGYLVVW